MKIYVGKDDNPNRNPIHNATLEVACSFEQLAAMGRQAEREGKNLSNWARNILLRALPKRRKKGGAS